MFSLLLSAWQCRYSGVQDEAAFVVIYSAVLQITGLRGTMDVHLKHQQDYPTQVEVTTETRKPLKHVRDKIT